MSQLESFQYSNRFSSALTIAGGAASGTATPASYYASSSKILGYTITSGANPGTLSIIGSSAAGVNTITATTSANVAAGVPLVLVVYWINEKPPALALNQSGNNIGSNAVITLIPC